MGKQENIKIFEDTETLCKTNSSLKQSIKNSICNQKLILQNQRINSNNQKRYEKPANIIVSKKRTLQAASAYKNTKTAVHNFASATNPGGGVKRILDTALSEDDETIILGAFGCGAFMNDPQIVAQAAKNVIREYLYSFKNIEFAVYCSPRDDRNYRIFDRVLKR